ncbi:MAG: hypothetical protein E7263_08245 [Lachnospiraceae bacterium]|nr:hypothetical protein [Lachnospiraceae bacterium]
MNVISILYKGEDIMIKMRKITKRIAALCMSAVVAVTIIPPFNVVENTIQAAGEEFVIEDGALKDYKGSKRIVTIPDGVTEIEEDAFACWGNSNKVSVERIIMPDSVEIIHDGAFRECDLLTSVEMSPNVYYLGKNAFNKCTSLQKIDLSKTKLSVIQKHTFENCEKLTDVALPDGVIEIAESAFRDCINLARINIPEGVELISKYSFYGCRGLCNIELPTTLKRIGKSAFCGCDSLLSLRIPEGVTILPENMLKGCFSLKELHLPDTLRVIQDYAIETSGSSYGNLIELYIPNSVEVMGSEPIDDRESYIGTYSSIKGICKAVSGSYIECYLNEQHSKERPKYLNVEYKEVEYDSTINFDACGGKLDTHSKRGIIGEMYGGLPIPYLNGYQFTGWYLDKTFKKEVKCTDLIEDADVVLYARWEKESEEEPVIYEGEEDDFVIVDGVLEEYLGKQSVVVVPEGVTKIDWDYLNAKEWIREIILPDSLEEIAMGSFMECTSLMKINIPEKITEIKERTFEGCVNLVEVDIEGDLITIGESAFGSNGIGDSCSSLQTINLPPTLKTIKKSAFSSCSTLMDIDIPEAVECIEKSVFASCNGLVDVKIPASVSVLSEYVFRDCKLLSDIVLSDGLKTIEKGALEDCNYLHDIYIPESAEQIDPLIFKELGDADERFRLTILGIKGSAAYDIFELIEAGFKYTDVTFKRLKNDATINYDEESAGEVLESKKAIVGQAYGVLPVLSKDNMEFEGWSDGSKIVKSTDIVEKDTTLLTAVWRDPNQKEEIPVEEEGIPTILPKDEEDGDDETEEYIEISTAEQLNDIRNNMSGKYILTADIDLSEETAEGGVYNVGGYGWQPIGAPLEGLVEPFKGVFDGNGHTISGLTMTGDVPYLYVGLFSRIQGGQVKDLVIDDCNISVGGNPTLTGALAGYIGIDKKNNEKAVISNVTVEGKVAFNADKDVPTKNICIGGIVGYIGKGTMEDCHNKANVSYFSKEEEEPYTASSRFLGGVTGYIQGGDVLRSSNTGNVSGCRKYYGLFKSEDIPEGDFVEEALAGLDVYNVAGGICGVAAEDGSIRECYNAGNICNYMYNKYLVFEITINSFSNTMTGGIIGATYRDTYVEDCYNTGKVYGYSERDTTIVPKEIGDIDEFVYEFMKILDEVTINAPCTNNFAYVGGIVGYSTSAASGPITRCYNIGQLSGSEGETFPIANGEIPAFYCRYLENDAFVKGAEVYEDSLLYCKSFSEETMLEEDTYRTYDLNNTWLFVEDSGMSYPQLYNNLESQVSNVQFTSQTLDKSEYAYGEAIDLSGYSVSFDLEGLENPISFDVPDSRECGYNSRKSGIQHLTLDYFGVTEAFDVVVAPKHYHEYEMVFDWNEEDCTCEVRKECATCDKVINFTSTVKQIKEIKPDYVTEGKKIYEVTATYNKKEYTKTFEVAIPCIEKKDLSLLSISISKNFEYTYSGNEIKPYLSVLDNNHSISSNYYDVIYENNINAGEGKVTIVAKEGNIPYKGSVSATFTINKMSQFIYARLEAEYVKQGENTKVIGGEELYGDVIYKSSDENIAVIDEDGVIKTIGVGTVTITISTEGDSNHGAASYDMYLHVNEAVMPTAKPTTKPVTEPTIKPTTEPTVKPTTKPTAEPTVKATTKPVAEATMKPTTKPTAEPTTKPVAEATMKPTKEPTTKPVAEPTIKPTVELKDEKDLVDNSTHTGLKIKSTKILKLKNLASKKISIKWKKISKVTGYEIKYIVGNKSRIIKVKGANKNSKTIGSLKKGKTYKVSVRSYKKIEGKTIYSKWSAVKKIKIKRYY